MKWLLAIALGMAGCTKYAADAERREEQREFVRLNSRVHALQIADNTDKSAALKALRTTSCERLCEFRTTCVGAFERHVEALNEMHFLQQELQAAQANPARVGQDLLVAERKLSAAQPLINDCGRLQGELQRRL